MEKRAILLAGGRGVRLRPYTTVIPKPLVPVGGDSCIMEIVIRQLRASGFRRITIAVNHLSELIMAFFGRGEKWGVSIDYSLEEKSLSTIGPLTLIKDLPEAFLVMNGDILCNLDYQKLFRSHLRSGADVTVATYERVQKIDFGVLKYDSKGRVVGFQEKPEIPLNVSMGVYVINRKCIENIPRNRKYGFDDLMRDGIRRKARFQAYPFRGYWLDIGRPDDYDQANDQFARFPKRFLKGTR